jgi:hypothetical protein
VPPLASHAWRRRSVRMRVLVCEPCLDLGDVSSPMFAKCSHFGKRLRPSFSILERSVDIAARLEVALDV